MLELADQQKIAVIAKKSLLEGASVWAQGATDTDDRWKMPADKHTLTDINRFLGLELGASLSD